MYIVDGKFGLPLLIDDWDCEDRLQNPKIGEIRTITFENMSLSIGGITYQTLNPPYALRLRVKYKGEKQWVLIRVNDTPIK